MAGDNPTLDASDLSGQTLGQYQIVRQLGEGGMATVYLGEQTSIGRTVAIKVLPPHFMHDATFMQRFEREVKVIAELQHPRVLPVYDYGQIGGRPYIVMAYMAGGTLADLLEKGPIELDEVVRLIGQIAEGLDHAHRKGIIHRDFKPSNVLIDQHGNAYLADFGIAKISESTVQLTGTGIVGTPAYMAPEMGQHGSVTPQVDVYAVGVTLYQMLTGKYPFKGDTPLSVMMAHATRPVPDVREARPDLPNAISDVVRTAMAKEPADRYQSAGELARALRAAVAAAAEQRTTDETAIGRAFPATIVEQTPSTPPPPPRPSTPPPPVPSGADDWRTTPGTPGYQPGVTPPPAVERKGGCRWGLWAAIGGVLVVVLICIGVTVLGGGAAALTAMFATATSTPTNTPVPTETPTPTETPRPTDPPAGPTPGAGGGGSLIVENRGSAAICYVQVSPRDADSWGEDQLGANDTIASGSSYTIYGIVPGNYDFRALDCDQAVLDEHYGIDLTLSPFTWTVFDATSRLIMINNSSFTVCELYVSAQMDGVWGINRLGDNRQVAVGQQFTVNIASGIWDLRATACDGNTYWEQYEVDVATAHEWTLID